MKGFLGTHCGVHGRLRKSGRTFVVSVPFQHFEVEIVNTIPDVSDVSVLFAIKRSVVLAIYKELKIGNKDVFMFIA
jgi:hypothetical protein